MNALVGQIRARPNIGVIDDITIACLLAGRDGCGGAWGWSAKNGAVLILAGAVVVATGGASRIFERSLNPPDVAGDGYALAYEAGARLVNMEFMQIGFGFCHPIVNIFNGYIWEGYPVLRNGSGREFLSDRLPAGLTPDMVMHEHRKHFPFSSSGISKHLELAVHREIADGRHAEHGGVAADLTHMTDGYVLSKRDDCGLHHMWPIARDYMRDKGCDLTKRSAEICCYAHAINGGIKIGRDASASIPGLYAAGETAGGPHGADRLGGNMLVACQVFGEIAGKSAAARSLGKKAKDLSESDKRIIEEKTALLHKKIDAVEIVAELRKMNQKNLLLSRNEAGLRSAMEFAEEMAKAFDSAPLDDRVHIENAPLHSMLAVTMLIAGAALRREESRGSHYREDFPDRDDSLSRPFYIEKHI
jgi:L-aspartate oxidase